MGFRFAGTREERPKCHPGIWEGLWCKKAGRGIEKRWETSEGLRIGLRVLSVTRKTTLVRFSSSIRKRVIDMLVTYRVYIEYE